MKKVLIALGWLSCLLLVGCQEEDVVVPEKSYESFHATIENIGTEGFIEQFITTRSHLVHEQEVLWDEGDSIGIFSDKQEVGKYLYSNGAFNGERIEGKEFHAFYPFKQDAIDPENPNLIHTRLHYRDKYEEGTFSRPLPMVAVSENNELHFEHTCGILHFSVRSSLYVKLVYLLANDRSELICGNGVIDLSEETPVFKMVPDDETLRYQIDYWVEDVLNPDQPTDIYFIVPVGVYKKGITLRMKGYDLKTGEELIFNKVTEKPVEVRRAVIKSYSVVDYDDLLHEEMDSRKKERQALMDLYHATDGDHWKRNDNWGSDKPLSEWYGIVMNDNGTHVRKIELYDNGLKGELPASIGDLKSLEILYLPKNQLTGELPETIGNLTRLEALYLYYNQLTGTIPDSFVNLTNLYYLWVQGNHMDGTLSEALLKSDWWNNLFDKRILQAKGYKLKYGWLYESTDFSEDGTVVELQTHTEGNGIPIVITGEAYSDRMMDRFEQLARESMEYFFDIEPYTTFRSCFDVYMVKAVSRNEVLGEDVVFSTDHDGDGFITDLDAITEYLHKVPAFEPELGNAVGIVILHDREGRSFCMHYEDRNAITLTIEHDDYVLQHEAGGHGFGHLGDEYFYDDPTGNTRFKDVISLSNQHKVGWFLNLDSRSDPTKVYWCDFIANSDYAVEVIGVYEGGLARYSKGIYRPTEASIMSNPQASHRFNAPSRWIIYQRLMQWAGLECSFEDFLEYDRKNLAEIASEAQATNCVEVGEPSFQPYLYRQPLHDCIVTVNKGHDVLGAMAD